MCVCMEKIQKEEEKMPGKDRPSRTRHYLRDVEGGKENEIG